MIVFVFLFAKGTLQGISSLFDDIGLVILALGGIGAWQASFADVVSAKVPSSSQ